MHVLNYLNAEATKLWAERAEAQARGWRRAGYVLLLLLIAQTWLVVDTVNEMTRQRQVQEQRLQAAKQIASERLDGVVEHSSEAKRDLQSCQFSLQQERTAATELQSALVALRTTSADEIYAFSEQARDYSTAVESAEHKFKVCLSANAGLVAVLREFDQTVKRCRADLADAEKFYEGEQSEIYVALQRAVDAEEVADAAKKSFAICKSANAGLVESLQDFDRLVKDQQALIVESVELAKRCEVSPVTWAQVPTTLAAEAPAAWQVVGHAR